MTWLKKVFAARWRRWTAGGVAAVALLGFGVPYGYAQFVDGPAPPPLAVSAEPTAVVDVPVDGAWKVGAGSQAGYRTDERLGLYQHHDVVGRTPLVTGDVTIAGTEVTAAKIDADMSGLKSDDSQRDSDVQQIANFLKYPHSVFTLDAPADFGTVPTGTQKVGVDPYILGLPMPMFPRFLIQ